MRVAIFAVISIIFLVVGIILSVQAPKYKEPKDDKDIGKYGKYIAGAVVCFLMFIGFGFLSYYNISSGQTSE